MKKLFKVMGVVAVCAAFSLMVYNQVNAKPENSILAKNIEALAQNEGGGGTNNDYECKLEKDDCYFKILTEAQLDIIKKKLPNLGGVELGVTVDLTSGTQIYRSLKWYEFSGVRCGNDVTCNDFLRSLGLFDKIVL